MYALQNPPLNLHNGITPMSDNGFIRFEGVREYLPVTELFKIYKFGTLVAKRQASVRTKNNNILRMEQILKHYGIDLESADITVFRSKTGADIPICDDWVAHRGCNEMRQARSIFSKAWIKRYKQLGIDTSCFNNWIALSLEGVRVTPFDANRKELDSIRSKCEALKESDKDMYLMYALAYGLGLRSSEIQRARFDDLREDFDGNKLIRIHDPKSGGEYQDRPCDPSWWDEILSFSTGGNKFIVPVQEDRITREFPFFLRRICGVVDDRPVHRLRKYCGHRVMRENGNNAFVASKALGHSSVEITSRVYVGMPTIQRSF